MKNPLSNEEPIAVSAALAFLFASLSLQMYTRGRSTLARVFAFVPLTIGTVVITRHLFPQSIDLDQLFVPYKLANTTELAPGRMAANTALAVSALGAALVLNDRRWQKAVDALLLFVLLLGFTAFGAHLYSVNEVLLVPFSTQMATLTSLNLIALALAVALINSDRGFIAQVTDGRIGGLTARRLLPYAVLLPVFVGALTLYGELATLYNTNIGVTLIVSATVCFLSVLIWWTARWLNAADARRDQVEEELKSTNENTRLIVDRANDAFVRMDAAGIIQDWNPAAEDMFGWTRAEILGHPLHETIVPERYRDAHIFGLKRYLVSGQSRALNQRIELNAVRRNGTEFPVELSIFPVKFRNDETFCAFINDITIRKEAQRRINEFISTVSHELRTPLTSIKAALGLMNGGLAGALPAKAEALVRVADLETERLIRLVNDILDIRKIEEGKLTLKLVDANAQHLIDRALQGINWMASQYSISLHNEFDQTVTIRCDEDRIIQVLTNFLSNAIKFSSKNSTVKVKGVMTSPDVVRICVEDHGLVLMASK